MDDVIFTFDSVTYASKAKKILSRAGIPSKLIKLTNVKDGCIHGVIFSRIWYFNAVAALREASVAYGVRKSSYGLF